MFLLLKRENTSHRDKEGGVFDWDFIKTKTQGIEEFLEHLQTFDFQEVATP